MPAHHAAALMLEASAAFGALGRVIFFAVVRIDVARGGNRDLQRGGNWSGFIDVSVAVSVVHDPLDKASDGIRTGQDGKALLPYG